jgi:hypothetical protein
MRHGSSEKFAPRKKSDAKIEHEGGRERMLQDGIEDTDHSRVVAMLEKRRGDGAGHTRGRASAPQPVERGLHIGSPLDAMALEDEQIDVLPRLKVAIEVGFYRTRPGGDVAEADILQTLFFQQVIGGRKDGGLPGLDLLRGASSAECGDFFRGHDLTRERCSLIYLTVG